MKSITHACYNYFFRVLVLLPAVMIPLCTGCSAITNFDRDLADRQNSGNAGRTNGTTTAGESAAGNGGTAGTTPLGDTLARDASIWGDDNTATPSPVKCTDPSVCPTFGNPCFETLCQNGFCTTVDIPQATECAEEECGTINKCGQPIGCGPCEDGFHCVEGTCITDCGGCYIDGTCQEVGTINPNNECEICSRTESATSWSPNSGALCDDGKYCSKSDKCEGVVCVGEARDCDDGIDCNGVETCSEEDGSCLPGTPTCEANKLCDAAKDQCVSACDPTDCEINRTCIRNGEHIASNVCFVCDTANNDHDWTVAVGKWCGDAETECSGVDTCDGRGHCMANHFEEGTLCGSGPNGCSRQDTCDGYGNCLDNHYGTNITCGNPPGPCENQDYCDGNGSCRDWGFKQPGTACGRERGSCSYGDYCDGRRSSCITNNIANGTWCRAGDSQCSWFECDDGECNHQARAENGTPCGSGNDFCKWHECQGGNCQSNWIYRDCREGKSCTADSCDARNSRCVHETIDCNDHNACTADSCDTVDGCQYSNINCNDNNACTTDSCDRQNGCQHSNIDCRDNNVCTTDSCDRQNGCQHSNINCSDNDVCTNDSCDPVDGCQHSNINCNDNDACTNDSCDPVGGCQHSGIDCRDGNLCTADSCHKQHGCQHSNIDCNDHDACTTDSCNPEEGCQYSRITCDDNLACTTDSCDAEEGCRFIDNCDTGYKCDSETGECVSRTPPQVDN